MLVGRSDALDLCHFSELPGCQQHGFHVVTLGSKIWRGKLENLSRVDGLVDAGALLLADFHSPHQGVFRLGLHISRGRGGELSGCLRFPSKSRIQHRIGTR